MDDKAEEVLTIDQLAFRKKQGDILIQKKRENTKQVIIGLLDLEKSSNNANWKNSSK